MHGLVNLPPRYGSICSLPAAVFVAFPRVFIVIYKDDLSPPMPFYDPG